MFRRRLANCGQETYGSKDALIQCFGSSPQAPVRAEECAAANKPKRVLALEKHWPQAIKDLLLELAKSDILSAKLGEAWFRQKSVSNDDLPTLAIEAIDYPWEHSERQWWRKERRPIAILQIAARSGPRIPYYGKNDVLSLSGRNILVFALVENKGGRSHCFEQHSYSDAAGTTVANQVLRQDNGLGQLTTEFQASAGAVNVLTTPKVQYAYTEMAGGANFSRLVSMTYPNGRVLTSNYAAGINNTISRLSSLSDSTGTLESYTYLGLGTLVNRSLTLAGIDQTKIKLTAEAVSDSQDAYTGLDQLTRFATPLGVA